MIRANSALKSSSADSMVVCTSAVNFSEVLTDCGAVCEVAIGVAVEADMELEEEWVEEVDEEEEAEEDAYALKFSGRY